MAISLLDNIAIKKQAPNVERDLFNTVADMVAFSENYLPAVFECNIKETGERYRYNVSNPVDNVLGKWRLISSGQTDLTDYYNKTEVNSLLDLKVDVEDDKGLSTNDYDTEAKAKVDAIPEDPKYTDTVYDDTEIKDSIDKKVDSEEGKSLVLNTDITQITTNKTAIETLIADENTEGSIKNIVSIAIGATEHLTKELIDHKPTVDEAKANVLYLVPTDKEGIYEQYCLIGDAIATLGNTEVDLSNYIQKDEGASGVAFEDDTKPLWTDVDKALKGLIAKVYYVKPAITSFTVTPSTTTYEVGQKVDSLTFNWSVNKDVATQTLTDCTITADDRTATYNTELSASKTFTLKVDDGEETASSSIAINFRNKAYYGSASKSDTYDSTFILGLSKSAFATTVKGTYDIAVGAGEYGFLCVPNSFTKISSWYIGGFEVDLIDEGTISFTNASGGVETYRIYRTSQPSLGSIKIEVK